MLIRARTGALPRAPLGLLPSSPVAFRPRPGGLPLAWAAAAVLAGCAGGESAGGWSVAVDSAGTAGGGPVRVTNTPPAEGAAPTLLGLEELRVGTLEGGQPGSFGMLRQVAVLDDGSIAVADAQAEEVRLFDREGRHLRTFGGKGEGPGELSGMQGVFRDHEGRLRVAEQGNARLSIFDPDSGFVASFPLQLFSYGFRGPWEAAMDGEGRTFVSSSGRYGEGRFWNMLRVYDPAMRQLDSIPFHEYTNALQEGDPPGAWRISLGAGFTFAPVPFFAQAQQVVAPSGEFWTSAEGSRHLTVARWTPGGDTTLVLVSLREPEPVTAAERDSALAEVLEDVGRWLPSPPKLDPARVPAFKPPSHALSLDDRGRLWVRLTPPERDSTTYDVFTPDGRHAETVALPFRVDRWIPPVVRGDTVWAVVTDATDVQYVVRARLRRAAEGDAP